MRMCWVVGRIPQLAYLIRRKEAQNGQEATEETPKGKADQGDELGATAEAEANQKGRVVWVPVLVTAAIIALALKSNEGGSVRLGEFFTLDELTRTDTGLPNVPSGQSVANLQNLVEVILDPLRVKVGPLLVTSGYRSPEVNAHPDVNGSPSSQHLKGQAADVVPMAASVEEVLTVLRTLPVDQVITYSDTNHVHISTSTNPRYEFLYRTSAGHYEAMT